MAMDLPLSKDGYLDTAWFTQLAREIDKFAAKEGLKPSTIYYSPKVIPKFDKTKEKAGGTTWTKKRAQIVKTKSRAPAAGSRVKMVVQLRLYKNIEDPEYGFHKDIRIALKAIDQHNKLAERVVGQIKKEAEKLRNRAAKEFDANIDCFIEEFLGEDAVEGEDYAIGQSMMGKTVILRLPNGGYVSLGKSDETKFDNALASGDDDEDDEKPAKKKKKADVEKKKKKKNR